MYLNQFGEFPASPETYSPLIRTWKAIICIETPHFLLVLLVFYLGDLLLLALDISIDDPYVSSVCSNKSIYHTL